MKFITVIDLVKIDEIIENGVLENNCAFDLEGDVKSIFVRKLSDLNLDSDSVINGFCIDGRSGDLGNLWSYYINTFPVKTGDVLVQFSVEEDECVFCDFNSFMEFNYCGDYDSIKDIVSYRFDQDKIAFTQQLDLLNFEKAFIISSEWSKDNLINSSMSDNSSLVTNFRDLKTLGESCVWR